MQIQKAMPPNSGTQTVMYIYGPSQCNSVNKKRNALSTGTSQTGTQMAKEKKALMCHGNRLRINRYAEKQANFRGLRHNPSGNIVD
ncbi:hypothetical protein DdX_11392 [Ditylenchus destructor]|uniref:Uncharacterized protein n=1 Tax=Ditylenchus destructor TaxID=166010 RepID=A0AAD4MWC2_9BILA|nr:hypothetical protein DdX_11392 [Ditylenchus destructor]